MRRLLLLAVLLASPALAATGQRAGVAVEADVSNRKVTSTGGTTARALKDRFGDGVYNPKDFGAVCNATVDDTAAVQAAYTQAGTRQGVVKFTEMCRITAPVTVPLGVSTEGIGPTYAAGIYADGTAVFQLVGANYGGGWAFRQYFRNMMIRHKVGSAAPAKLIEINSGYNIEFRDLYIADVPSASSAIDITTANDINIENVVIRGVAGGSTNIGVKVSDESTVKIVNPDFEVLFAGIQTWGAAKVDVINPYFERNIVGVDNNAATGRVHISGGLILASNDSGWPVRNFTSGAVTTIDGTTLKNDLGTQTLYSVATADLHYWDPVSKRFLLGRPAAAGQVAAPSLFSLNMAGLQGPDYGISLGPSFQLHLGTTGSGYGDDLVFLNSTGAKTARFYGTGAATLSIYTDDNVTAAGTVSAGYGLKNTATGAPPTCSSTHRGLIWHTQGGAGVKDAVQVCAKDAADAYAWRTIY